MTVNRARSAKLASLVLALASVLAACATGGESSTASGSTSASPEPTSAVTDGTTSAEPPASAEPPGSEEPTDEAEVRITGARFEPAELTVTTGTEVVIVNDDNYDHTVTEGTGGQAVDGAFVNAEVPAESTLRVVFDEPGTFEITCIIHPTMQMTITVED